MAEPAIRSIWTTMGIMQQSYRLKRFPTLVFSARQSERQLPRAALSLLYAVNDVATVPATDTRILALPVLPM